MENTKSNLSSKLEEFKKSNPDKGVCEFECLDKNGKEVAIFITRPSRKMVTEYLTLSNSNMYSAERRLIMQCLLNEKERVAEDDTLFGSVLEAITQVIPQTGATLKNS